MIPRFIGNYWFLSNFYTFDFKWEGHVYHSTEHFYQSMKAIDPDEAEVVRRAPSPKKAREFGGRVRIREDWDEAKLVVMELALIIKFHHPYLKKKLLDTGDEYLQEGNTWYDTFWGVDLETGQGENHLGQLLMKVRESIREEDSRD